MMGRSKKGFIAWLYVLHCVLWDLTCSSVVRSLICTVLFIPELRISVNLQ